MKVKIMQRSVYHKYAEVEIEVPNDWNNKDGIDGYYYDHLNDYLFDNEDLYTDEIDEKMSKAEYEFGFGLGDGMDEKDNESEWRYEVVAKQDGGHL